MLELIHHNLPATSLKANQSQPVAQAASALPGGQ